MMAIENHSARNLEAYESLNCDNEPTRPRDSVISLNSTSSTKTYATANNEGQNQPYLGSEEKLIEADQEMMS